MKIEDFKLIVDSYSDAILIVKPCGKSDEYITHDNIDFDIIYKNAAFEKIFPGIIEPGLTYDGVKDNLPEAIDWRKISLTALRDKTTQFITFYSLVAQKHIQTAVDPVENLMVILHFTDITKEKEHELQLKRQNARLAALTDELSDANDMLKAVTYTDFTTGLPSKIKFTEDAKKLIDVSTQIDSKFAIMLINLDNIKEINDSKGRETGDMIIKKTANILQRFESKDIHIYRCDGDEFLLIVENLKNRNRMITIGDTLLEAMNLHRIRFSAGISIFKEDATSIDDLMRFADMAMQTVKKHGRNNFTFFQMSMHKKFMDKLNILTKLNNAVSSEVFQQFYQPQYDVASGELRGFEALIRWHDPDLGWISPDEFIPIAEESKLVIPIGEWVLETAVAKLKKWSNEFGFNGIMSINVSPVQLKNENFLENFKILLKKYDVSPKQIEIEITEGIFIDDPKEVICILNNIRDMGIGISLDDFGTGYSSLRYLQMLPITTLKIDKSFIANITDKNGVEANITNSIISMVTNMGLDTIAEGVEDQSQLEILKAIKCHTIQGFLKGKPMTSEDCEKLLK